MQERFLAVTVAIGLFLQAGCCPSLDQVKKMRIEQLPPEKTGKNLDSLLTYFQKPNDPIWRAETMTTMVSLDTSLGLRSKDPDFHAKVVSALKAEYDHPRVKPGGKVRSNHEDDYALRAWAIYSLGRMNEPELQDYFVAVICSSTDATDERFQIRLAAFNSLKPNIEQMVSNSTLRNRLLSQLPKMQAELSRRSTAEEPYASAKKACDFFESKLKSYPALVEILRAPAKDGLSDESLLQILEWDYQRLRMGDHKTAQGQTQFRSNIQSLVTLSWHPTEAVRARARVILSEYAPESLLSACTGAISSRQLLKEDAILLANLIPLADKQTGYAPGKPTDASIETYSKTRNLATDALFAQIEFLSLDQREIVYARLLAYDPLCFRRYLCSLSPRMSSEESRSIAQHLRYLNHLRTTSSSAPMNVAEKREVVLCMTSFMSKHDSVTRQTVTAYLLQEEPMMLALASATCVKCLAEESVDDAKALLATYMACLEVMEKRNKAPYDKQMIDAFKMHPYEVLAYGLERDEADMKGSVAAFLRSREPNLLARLLAANMSKRLQSKSEVPFAEYAMLGDVLEESRKTIAPETYKSSIEVIKTGLKASDEDLSLLCGRYLLELGEKVPDGAQKLLALRQLVRTASTRPTASTMPVEQK